METAQYVTLDMLRDDDAEHNRCGVVAQQVGRGVGLQRLQFCSDSLTLARHVYILANVNSLYAVARPSVVSLSVTLVHPTQPVEIFGMVSMPFGTLAISIDIHGKFYGYRPRGIPPSRGVKRKRDSQI